MLSGPSGVGKGTVIEGLRRRLSELAVSVSATTRPPRAGEIDGVHYHFLTDGAFDELIAGGGLLEWAEFAGARYGTPAVPVFEALEAGRTVLLEIEVQGARQVRARIPEALFVFLVPPDLGELARRLQHRGTEAPEVIAGRLDVAVAEELAAADAFDVVVVNDDVERAVDEIARILRG